MLIACAIGCPTLSVEALNTRRLQDDDLRGAGQKAIIPLRTESPIKIDGMLSEPEWDQAEGVDDFTQVWQHEGAEPSERTIVRVLYDQENINVGFTCLDSQPEEIHAKELRRDVSPAGDDRIALVLDTFDDNTNGYFFQINPLGSKLDGLIVQGGTVVTEWDGIWDVECTIDESGWIAEIRIPTKTVSFDPGNDSWGINFSRMIQRLDEYSRWSSPFRNTPMLNPATAGQLTNLADLEQGSGLEFRPYALMRHNADTGDTDVTMGGDISYSITPAITALLTFNTDFAETEVDDRRVNLTRFPLFFPEKRDFFLQDAGIFKFGGLNQDPIPFHSRRIGIVAGQQKDILAGFKLTGRTANSEFGILDVQMDDDSMLGDKNLLVGRYKHDLSETMSAGVIVTNGDPSTTADNTLVGGDFRYDNPSFNGTNRLVVNAWYQHTFSRDNPTLSDDDGSAVGLGVIYPNEPFNATLFVAQVEDEYNPALGFSAIRGIRSYESSARYRWREEGAGFVDLTVAGAHTTDLDDEVVTSSLTMPHLRVQNSSGDHAVAYSYTTRERIDQPFIISQGVTIPPGRYDALRFGAGVGTAVKRPVYATVLIEGGEFFEGNREDYIFRITWKPSPYFNTEFNLIQNDVDLPYGEFTTRIGRLRLNMALNPDVSWSNFAQYDNVSETLGWNSRLRWTVTPGNDIFLELNQGYDDSTNNYQTIESDLALKIGLTFRF
ncbi:MAG: DUF5916 domain-containing protein [Phycisphaerales bacterium JB043]